MPPEPQKGSSSALLPAPRRALHNMASACIGLERGAGIPVRSACSAPSRSTAPRRLDLSPGLPLTPSVLHCASVLPCTRASQPVSLNHRSLRNFGRLWTGQTISCNLFFLAQTCIVQAKGSDPMPCALAQSTTPSHGAPKSCLRISSTCSNTAPSG